MKTAMFTAVVTPLLLFTVPTVGYAETSTAPLFTLGLQGSYTQLEINGRNNETEDMPEGGLFINYGNKMTARQGLVYQAEASGMYSKQHDQKLKDGRPTWTWAGAWHWPNGIQSTCCWAPVTNGTGWNPIPAAMMSTLPTARRSPNWRRGTITASIMPPCVSKRAYARLSMAIRN